MSKIILIRHAESLANVDSSAYRWPDCANILSRHGVEQALALRDKMLGVISQHFNGEPYTVITSDLTRAKITGAIIMSMSKNHNILHDKRITECDENDYGLILETKLGVLHRFREAIQQHEGHLILVSHCHAIQMVTGRRLKNAEHIVLNRDILLKRLPKEPKIWVAS